MGESGRAKYWHGKAFVRGKSNEIHLQDGYRNVKFFLDSKGKDHCF